MPVTTLNALNYAQAYGTGTSQTTASTTNVSTGIGVAFTPKSTGNVLVLSSGVCGNNTTGDGINITIFRTTGAIPASGSAVTGTALGGVFTFTALTGNLASAFATQDFDTPTIGTAVNYYIAMAAVTGGTASVGTGNMKPSIIVIEL